jgi:hypothetical protein
VMFLWDVQSLCSVLTFLWDVLPLTVLFLWDIQLFCSVLMFLWDVLPLTVLERKTSRHPNVYSLFRSSSLMPVYNILIK